MMKSFSTGVIEIRSIRVGVVALKAVHTGFYVAMNRRGRLYGSVSGSAAGGRGLILVGGPNVTGGRGPTKWAVPMWRVKPIQRQDQAVG